MVRTILQQEVYRTPLKKTSHLVLQKYHITLKSRSQAHLHVYDGTLRPGPQPTVCGDLLKGRKETLH